MFNQQLVQEKRKGFTLIELLVVISIITVLIAAVLVSFVTVRRAARETDTRSRMGAIEGGLGSYDLIFGSLPPSGSDQPNSPYKVYSPYKFGNDTTLSSAITGSDTEVSSSEPPNWPEGGDQAPGGGSGGGYTEEYTGPPVCVVSGANLLVWALAGADLLGTPGFRDLDGDGMWWDDMTFWMDGLYGLETVGTEASSSLKPGPPGNPSGRIDLLPSHQRYQPFIDTSTIVRMKDYEKDVLKFPVHRYSENQLFLVDGFGYPILYYRANTKVVRMVTGVSANGLVPGIYDQRDNAMYTGGCKITGGLNLGGGSHHQLRNFPECGVDSDPAVSNLNDFVFDETFAKFIWNRRVKARNEPVNKDSYMLISPGADALWGTEDDITNFKR